MRSTSMLRALVLVGVVPLALASGMGCPNSDDCEKLGSCGPYDGPGSGGAGSSTGGAGGQGGQGGSGGNTPPDCVPSEAGGAVGAECGIFVSSSLGDDGNDGKQDKPVASIKKALEIAGNSPIYVCTEETPYGVDVLIESAVEMYGGVDCANGWVYDAAKPTRIATAAGQITMRIKGVTGAVRIEDFDLTAANAVEDGGSSVGMFVANSMDVTLRRVNITAGTGVDGADAVLVPFPAGDFPNQAALNGNAADDPDTAANLGGAAKPCNCPAAAGETTGGKGGDEVAAPGQAGEDGLPNFGGGTGGLPDDCSPADSKGNAATPTPDAAGAMVLGTIDPELGWVPQPGAGDAHGKAGQGGGGGAGGPNNVGAGGGGGCGGCGGKGGPGGQGGGASIALLALDSTVTTEGGTFTAQLAGAGGDGDVGQAAQLIFGFGGDSTSGGCDGGNGGLGAPGAPGGGGAGGVSAAIVAKGGKPVVTGTDLVADAAAAPAGLGAGADNNGEIGVTQDTLELAD
jgi:hypothetical protein